MAKGKIKFDPKKFLYKNLIIDASVVAKAFLDEEGSFVDDELMRMSSRKDLNIMAPSIILPELLNVLSKNFRNFESVRWAFELFKDFGIGIIDPDNSYIMGAIKNACEYKNVSYYDASYHALAREFGAVFLTADKKYYDSVKEKENIVLFG